MSAPATTVRTRGDDPALTGTRAVLRHCRRCRLLILAGYDSPAIAHLATADPYLATTAQEAAAVILARPTWQLAGLWPTTAELIPRHNPNLDPLERHAPADTIPVVIAHHCGTPPLATRPLPTATAPAAAGDQPPF